MNILVVEDDDFCATLLRHIFEREGYAVEHVMDGKVARKVIEKRKPPDVVVLDYMLPYVSGLDLLKEMRSHADKWKDVPVIFLSARTSQQDIAKVLDAGANDYVTKPFGIDELGARVRRAAGL
jgi:two-component system phosphate regulon response regulator PhoB